MTTEPKEITAADVVAFLLRAAKENGLSKLSAYTSFDGSVRWLVEGNAFCDTHAGYTLEAAIDNMKRAGSPEVIAAEKRAEAAKLLAEADALSPKAA